jgi:hypothetical protein
MRPSARTAAGQGLQFTRVLIGRLPRERVCTAGQRALRQELLPFALIVRHTRNILGSQAIVRSEHVEDRVISDAAREAIAGDRLPY